MSETELQHVEPRELTPLEVIRALATDPNVDVAKLAAMLQMQERFEAREAEKAFNGAMTRLQAAIPRIVKSREIIVKGQLRSKYAALEDIDLLIRPLMIAEGLSASYTTEEHGPKETKITCIIRHVLGHKEPYSVIIPFDRSEYRSDAQSQASTVAFGRRLALCNALNIVTVGQDNDGQNDPLEETQLQNIMNMLDACKVTPGKDMDAFLKFAGAKSPETIQRFRYDDVMVTLKRKLKNMQEEGRA